MKIRLPNLPSMRRSAATPAAAPTPAGPGAPAPVAIGGVGDRLRLMSRRLRGAAGWFFLALAVFLVFVWISLPTRAIAWRIGQQAKKAGYIVDIENLSIRPWGTATLYNVKWIYAPSHPGQVPQQTTFEVVDVDVAVFKYLLFGDIEVTLDTAIEEAPIHAEYARNETESSLKISITELPLYDVPKLQQALGAPLKGLFAFNVDLKIPENHFTKAEGEISLECASCTIGDGQELLFIPGSSGLTAKGMTIPEIDLGTLQGKLVVKEGKATAETFGTKSNDIEVVVSGDVALADPFSKSEFNLVMKLLVTPALQEKSETLRFAVQTAGPSSKLDGPEQGWLGFKLKGNVGRPRFMGIKSKTQEERLKEKREQAAAREAAKKARASKGKTPPKESKAEATPPAITADKPTEQPALGLQPGTPETEADIVKQPVETAPPPSSVPPSALPSTAEPSKPVEEEVKPVEEVKPAEGGDGQGQGQGDQAAPDPTQQREGEAAPVQPTGGEQQPG